MLQPKLPVRISFTHVLHGPVISYLNTTYSVQQFSSQYSAGATGRTIRGLNPGRGKIFFSPPERPDRLWGQTSVLFSGYRCAFPGIKRREPNDDHSPPSRTEVKNEWSYKSTAHTRLHGVDRDLLLYLVCNFPQSRFILR
jgi:hypothetical protein